MQGADSMANPGKHVQWERNQPSGAATIARPASRDKKVARREDAGGLAPQVMVLFEPVHP